ncbi:MAG TPA: hypothetical protein VMB84_09795 [Stellaceae bacterium]|nr:hypothetical protein [Stellaceae bacterium]
MSEADDLTQRYLALWTQYLTALLANPQAIETLKRWKSFTGQFAYPEPGSEAGKGAAVPPWPPFFGPFGLAPLPPGAAAPPAQADGVATLAQRVDALERRVADLERRLETRRPSPARKA